MVWDQKPRDPASRIARCEEAMAAAAKAEGQVLGVAWGLGG